MASKHANEDEIPNCTRPMEVSATMTGEKDSIIPRTSSQPPSTPPLRSKTRTPSSSSSLGVRSTTTFTLPSTPLTPQTPQSSPRRYIGSHGAGLNPSNIPSAAQSQPRGIAHTAGTRRKTTSTPRFASDNTSSTPPTKPNLPNGSLKFPTSTHEKESVELATTANQNSKKVVRVVPPSPSSAAPSNSFVTPSADNVLRIAVENTYEPSSLYVRAQFAQSCTAGALVHQLANCGHKNYTEDAEPCAKNCQTSKPPTSQKHNVPSPKDTGLPFVCSKCLDDFMQQDLPRWADFNKRKWTKLQRQLGISLPLEARSMFEKEGRNERELMLREIVEALGRKCFDLPWNVKEHSGRDQRYNTSDGIGCDENATGETNKSATIVQRKGKMLPLVVRKDVLASLFRQRYNLSRSKVKNGPVTYGAPEF